jgi:cyanophycinase
MTRAACLIGLLLIVSESVAAAPPVAELPGPVVISGSAIPPKDAVALFFELAGKDQAKIVVLLTDKAKDDGLLKALKNPQAMTAVPADSDTLEKSLQSATGVWVSGEKPTRIEKELKKVQSRGVVVGGSASLLGIGLLPGFSAKPESGAVALTIEDGAAIAVKGRILRVIGDKSITLRIGKGAGKPETVQEAKAGSLFDTFQLRRAALNRAAENAFPPAKPQEPVVKKGSLVIIGGGGTTTEIMDTFFEKAGGKDQMIVVIPTTEEDGPGDAAFLRKYGATNLRILFTKNRVKADDPKFSEALTKAGGVWFGGGRQWRFVDSFEGTLVEIRCHEVLARGGAIGGSSAGASIQSEYMPRGHPLGNTVMAAEGYERGFGFLPGCAVDQHFFRRNRTADMTGLMKKYPQYLGIGIDESTAIVVAGSVAEVLGKSKVAFYDTKKTPTVDEDYEVLTAGEKYDLKKREKVK